MTLDRSRFRSIDEVDFFKKQKRIALKTVASLILRI